MSVAELVPGFVRSGKVRDIFALDDARLLLVASDRISAFDVVLPTPIPDKGRVLTGLSRYWFAATEAAGIMPNHLLSTDPADLPDDYTDMADELRGRMMICRRAEVLPVELIVRGYITGSGWKDYQRTGAVCGIPLPTGLREIRAAAAAAVHAIDQGRGRARREHLVRRDGRAGRGAAGRARARRWHLRCIRSRRARAESVGHHPGRHQVRVRQLPDGSLILIDEVLTPDSSRFWELAAYEPGRGQASYDKQFVRDYLETLDWGKTYPGPELPADVVAGTQQRYAEAFDRITRRLIRRYLAEDVDRVSSFRFAVDVMPRDGILDPAGKAVEAALPQLRADNVHGVRVGRRVELTVERLTPIRRAKSSRSSPRDFLANPLIESWQIEEVEAVPA